MQKIKDFLKKIWDKIKLFVKKNYISIINWIVLILVYANTDSLVGVQTLVGLWIFAQIGIAGYRYFIKKKV